MSKSQYVILHKLARLFSTSIVQNAGGPGAPPWGEDLLVLESLKTKGESVNTLFCPIHSGLSVD